MPTVSVNTHFPGYEILGELGRSNARVLKARQLATGDLVAIKHFTLHTDADTLRRFQQESQIMLGIQHPNIVRVREVQLDRDLPFIVMEWVEDGDLRKLIARQGQLDVSTTIRLGLQVAAAFKAIHPQGIIHRDIKPENLLYRLLPSSELHFLLTDFGVARLREQSHTLTGQSLMTYEYASPEQFDNPREVGVATDYYSLGVVLYECLTGRVPFALTDTAGIATFMNQVLRTAPPALTSQPDHYIPPSLATLLTRLLAKDPATRLSDVTELELLLSQAYVEQLQASRLNATHPDAPAGPVSASRTRTAPLPDRQPDVYPDALPDDEAPDNGSTRLGIAVGVLGVLLLIGLLLFYKSQHKPVATPPAVDSTVVVRDSLTPARPMADTARVPLVEPAEEVPADTVVTEPTTTTTASTTLATDTTTRADSARMSPH